MFWLGYCFLWDLVSLFVIRSLVCMFFGVFFTFVFWVLMGFLESRVFIRVVSELVFFLSGRCYRSRD